MTAPRPEAWLRGPVDGVPAALQPAAHALLQGQEELHRAARDLPPSALWLRPAGVASVGFHVRHAAGVIDRLLTYARGDLLDATQRAALAAEGEPGPPGGDATPLLAALDRAVAHAIAVYRATDPAALATSRAVGRAGLPSTVLGLLFHLAEHVQRHAGQAGTTATVVRTLYALTPEADDASAMALVRALHAALDRRDRSAITGAYAPGAESVHSPALPWGGVYRGADGAAAQLDAMAAHVDASFAMERLVPAGGHVVALGRLHGTARASGATFDVPATHAWTVRDGLVVRHEAYVDVPALLAALHRNRRHLETTAT